jgi:uncharacterized cupin superfamily protein
VRPAREKIGLVDSVNVFEAGFEYDSEDPAGYRAGVLNIGDRTSARETAIKLFEIPAGESLCPYHYEYVEEWLLVLEGEVAVRGPSGEEAAPRGTLALFPAGPDGAHKLANRGEQTARVLMFSSSRTPAVSVYPDSDKIGVWPGREEDDLMLRRADGAVPYYDGEA